MTSALCTVNGSSTLNGIDLSPGASVTIQLIDLSGVNSWLIRCISADDLHSTTDATLTVNSVTKTATFTMPSDTNGMSFLFESIVNNQYDNINQVSVPAWRQTFVICARAPNGFRPIPRGEKLDYNPTNGWIKEVNTICRAAGIPASLPGAGLYSSGPTINIGATDGSISIAADAISVGVINGTQHGNQTAGGLHAAATTSVNGFMPASDKLKLNNATSANIADTLALRGSVGEIDFGTVKSNGNAGAYIKLDPANFKLELQGNFDICTIDGAAASQNLVLRSGNASVGMFTGSTSITTGTATAIGAASGSVAMSSGLANGNSGNNTLSTGNSLTGNSGNCSRVTGNSALKSGDINDFIGTGATRGNINYLSSPSVAPTTAAQGAIYTGPGNITPVVPTDFVGCYEIVLPSDQTIGGITYKQDDKLIINRYGVKKVSF